jgi:hypothetical protein
MTTAGSLYEACDELFARYPQATSVINLKGTVCSMVLMMLDGDQAAFFVLVRDHAEDRSLYSFAPWHGGNVVNIEAAGSDMPDEVVAAVTQGIPFPRHGSLFGWMHEETVVALITIQARWTPECQEPSWTLMPLASAVEEDWPPFAGKRWFGPWFWDHHRTGSIVPLARLVAATRREVFWLDSAPLVETSCCAVAHDIIGQEGYTLRRGCYLYYKMLQMGTSAPPLELVLSDPSKTDLAPRFQRFLRVEKTCVSP